MSKMRWTRNSQDPNDPGCAPFFIVAFVFALLGLVGWGIYGLVQHFRNEQLIQNTVTQDNHKEIVKLKKDVITCLKLDAKHDQEWKFKTCDDYELVTIQKTLVGHSGGRGSSGWTTEGTEIWIKVKQPFILELNYKNEKGNDRFLYVKLDFQDK